MGDFEGRVAIVLGITTEVGRAVARAFAAAGAQVMIGNGEGSDADSVTQPVELGPHVEWLPAGASDGSSAADVMREAKRRMGRLDVLVQHLPTTYRGPADLMATEAWQRDLNVLTTTLLMARAFAAVAEPHAAIVNIASIDLAQAYPGRLTASTVANGLVGLSRSLAVEWATRPIRVNVVAPGITLTDPERQMVERGERSLDRVLLRAPSHRIGTAEETASAVLFLAGSCADFITGQSLDVDGGWSTLTQHAEGLRFP